MHVIETHDGGYLAVGNTPEVGFAEAQDGFVVKANADGTLAFNHRFFSGNGKWDGMLCSGEGRTSAGSYILAAGYKWTGLKYDRCLVKLNSTGGLVWEKTWASPGAPSDDTSNSGFEFMDVAANGDVVLSGFVYGAASMSLEFKSPEATRTSASAGL